MKKIIFFFSFLVILILSLIYTSRNPLIADDITPVSSCDNLIEKSDILFVIPDYEDNSLDKYSEWCERMRKFDKKVGLHGINHEYHEFSKPIEREELEGAISVFENCFGYKPTFFRPPYNKISAENEALVKSFNMTVYRDTYLTHPYCHCEPKGWIKFLNGAIGC